MNNELIELVSIITPTYNCGKFISRTIESVQAQTYRNWEMIIVDDLSKDNTKIIVDEYAKNDSRIKYFILEKNSGAAVARTIAMNLAKGEYIAFLDSDDIWESEKIEKQLGWMKKNGHNISCTSYKKIDENDKSIGKVVKSVEKTNYNRLLLDCPVGNSSVMYNVSALGKFEVPNIKKRNDDALWLLMLKKEEFIWGMSDVLMRYRIRKHSLSRNKIEIIQYHWKLYRDIEKISICRSIFHIVYWILLKVFRIK